MSVLLVTYDLNNETKRPPIVQDIKKLGQSWARLSESSYAIDTHLTPQQVYNQLDKHTDSDDQIAVITLKKPWYGYHAKDVVNWLEARLNY